MKIYDCTTFYSEHMMMDVRFNVLNEYVKKFIVVESIYSHRGAKKKLNFDIKLYTKFKDKIEYVVLEKEPNNLLLDNKNSDLSKRLNSIKRIEHQRNEALKGCSDATEDDYIFYSLECNKDKCIDAAKLYKNNDKMYILNEVIWNEQPDDF